MATENLLPGPPFDPDIMASMLALPPTSDDLTTADIPAQREAVEQMLSARTAALLSDPSITHTEHTIPGPRGTGASSRPSARRCWCVRCWTTRTRACRRGSGRRDVSGAGGRTRSGGGACWTGARAADLAGLLEAFVDVSSTEVFMDDAVAYAGRLWECGVQAELHVWPGGPHGFHELAPAAKVSRAANEAQEAWVRRVLRPVGE